MIDKDTKLYIIHKKYLGLINDVLDENYQYGTINFLDEIVRDPNNKWKQERVEKAIEFLNEYKQKKQEILNS